MKSYEKLEKRFEAVKKQGYIKSLNEYKNSVGITLENALGASGENFNIPDFDDIEIKAVRGYYDAEFDLFNSAPDGKYINSTKWISENYGYPDRVYKDINVFKGNIFCNSIKSIGIKYRFKLDINKEEKRIYLNIYNSKYDLINKDIFWDFDTLEEKLIRKDSKIALFWYCKKYIEGSTYFYFYKMKYYELQSFEKFIEGIEKGIIFLTFKIGVNKSGRNAGQFVDHGTSFRISKENLRKLFYEKTLVWDNKKRTTMVLK